jgi:hypothetical protein
MSNKKRLLLKVAIEVVALIPCVLEPDENAKPIRDWARLIQKIGASPGPDPGR